MPEALPIRPFYLIITEGPALSDFKGRHFWARSCSGRCADCCYGISYRDLLIISAGVS
jgi:hypothetical protein